MSEQQVIDTLGIENFQNLSADNIEKFVSMIPAMDKDVAISMVNQFPTYVECATNMITQLSKICESVLERNDVSQTEVIRSYMIILNDLSDLLKKENLTYEERNQITQKMIEIADRVAIKDTENKKFLEKLFKYGALAGGALAFLGLAYLFGRSGVLKKEDKLDDIDVNGWEENKLDDIDGFDWEEDKTINVEIA